MREECAQATVRRTADAVPVSPEPDVLDLAGENARLHREAQELRDALASRPVVDQATGILMAMYALDAQEASELLRRWSREHDLAVDELCSTLVALTTSDPHRPEVPRVFVRRSDEVLERPRAAERPGPDGPRFEP